ncbi:hypothetical protein [Halorussus sp. MSC15.2]|uniref:hypothetical protein n=1 Tax=Halorussus sp. MSC15.2 TaxID=2283638 RepID=UPI0013CFAD11|nr:hypothetical protein [Halorussus sp. MSC15.2]NEU56986.1 hypothetical protein [Halorussus sp. MSC15.2]
MRELPARRAAQVVPLVLVGALLVVVAGVGLVAAVAETQQTWRWYFRMEQAVATATPVALALSGASLVALFGAVFLTGEE